MWLTYKHDPKVMSIYPMRVPDLKKEGFWNKLYKRLFVPQHKRGESSFIYPR